MSKQTPLEVWENFDRILQAGTANAIGFDFRDMPQEEGRTVVRQVLGRMTSILEQFNKQWTKLFQGDKDQVDLWENRLRLVYSTTHNVIHSLEKRGGPDWDSIALDLGFINAFRVAAKLAIGVYRSERKQQDATGRA